MGDPMFGHPEFWSAAGAASWPPSGGRTSRRCSSRRLTTLMRCWRSLPWLCRAP